MSKTVNLWGQMGVISDDARGAIGVVVNGHNLRADYWEAAQRIAAAGPRGLGEDDEGGVPLGVVSFLETAGIVVREPGFRQFAIDALPEPTAYIQRDATPAAPRQTWGPYGSTGVPHDPYSRR